MARFTAAAKTRSAGVPLR